MLAAASAPTAEAAMEIEAVPVSTVTALVLVVAAPSLEIAAVAVGPGIVAGTIPVAAVARVATEIAASWKTAC